MNHVPFVSLINRRSFLRQWSAGAIGVMFVGGQLPRLLAADEERLLVHSKAPRNAEPALPDLVRSWVTPVESFFIRSHGNTPEINANSYRLSVEGMVETPLTLSLAELGRFNQHDVTATLTCAGNRRAEHSRIKPVKGVQWREGAIGNAKWRGAKLSDLLKKAGVRDAAKHVWFEGLDAVEDGGKTFAFGGSIPLEKALLDRDAGPGALLATSMNDKPLTADHGFPVRMVVPGYIGARSVKWLSKIVVSDRPSPNHFVADVYKLVDEGTLLEVAETGPIYRMPLNSAICTPTAGATLKSERVTVAGYALPPGVPGVSIRQVEVSADQGRSWQEAKLTSPAAEFCWQLWSAEIAVSSATKELIVRAIDSRGDVQPETVRWNAKGYLFNAWHHVRVN
ncbi:MAG: molybdopterin-dependent oxidoreductase [Planctomycetaceae bacterium]